MKRLICRVLSIIIALFVIANCAACSNSTAELLSSDTSSKPAKSSEMQSSNSSNASAVVSSNESSKTTGNSSNASSTHTSSATSSGSKIETSKFHKISSLDDLLQFANTVRAGYTYAGETVYLEKDIDLSGVEWTPIGNYEKSFNGVFCGNNHKIKNLKITSAENATDRHRSNAYVGFFGHVRDGQIKNLIVENVDIRINDSKNIPYLNVGGIVGYMSGYNKGISISSCKVTGNITIRDTSKAIILVGGMLGGFDANANNTTYNMSTLYSSVDLSVEGYWIEVGGISGIVSTNKEDTTNCNISDIIYKGKINYNGEVSKIGGFGGALSACCYTVIKNCFISTTLSTEDIEQVNSYFGFVFGDESADCRPITLKNIYANATINDKNAELLFVGRNNAAVNLENCNFVAQLPEDVPFNANKWDLTDLSSPKLKF